MNLELTSDEITLTEEQREYVFVIDADLARVGGGSSLVNY